MSIRTYRVTVRSAGGVSREIRVASPTDVQAGDAARPLMSEDEAILGIEETIEDIGSVEAGPPLSQAAELAPVTPGAAAAPEPGDRAPDRRF